jgi:molybdopterin-guanine dinucleotide biosynthesis protein A
MNPLRDCAGLILCGGFSQRMGSDKASLPFGDQTLLERIIDVVREVVDEVWLVAREGQSVPAADRKSLPIARDPAEGLGPLAALAAGLAAIGAERACLVSCDLPLLEPSLLAGLFACAEGHRAAIPRVDGYDMTTTAVYSESLLPEIREMLAAGARRPRDILGLPGVISIDEASLRRFDPELRSFVDCNTPERYREALRMAGVADARE